MKTEKSLWTSVSILIGAVIAVLAFVRGDILIWLLLGIFTLWGIWVVGFLLLPLIKRIKKNMLRKAQRKALLQEGYDTFQNSHLRSAESEGAIQLLLRHVNLRITGYIRNIYQEATWEWCVENPQELILAGGVGRIRVHGIEDYDHADIKIDKLGEISCNMLKTVPLNTLDGSDNSEEELSPNKQPVNTQIWYELQGRKILESAMADLNSRGYSTLTIREDGDVLIDPQDDFSQEHLANFPAKVYWPQLVKVLQGEGIAAQINSSGVQVTW